MESRKQELGGKIGGKVEGKWGKDKEDRGVMIGRDTRVLVERMVVRRWDLFSERGGKVDRKVGKDKDGEGAKVLVLGKVSGEKEGVRQEGRRERGRMWGVKTGRDKWVVVEGDRKGRRQGGGRRRVKKVVVEGDGKGRRQGGGRRRAKKLVVEGDRKGRRQGGGRRRVKNGKEDGIKGEEEEDGRGIREGGSVCLVEGMEADGGEIRKGGSAGVVDWVVKVGRDSFVLYNDILFGLVW